MNDTIIKQINEMASQLQKMADAYKPQLPEVKFNKNGYEIRTQVLDMAKQWTEFEFAQKYVGWDVSAKRDPETGQVVTKVDMPAIPGVDNVLENAEKFYNFVNNSK